MLKKKEYFGAKRSNMGIATNQRSFKKKNMEDIGLKDIERKQYLKNQSGSVRTK